MYTKFISQSYLSKAGERKRTVAFNLEHWNPLKSFKQWIDMDQNCILLGWWGCGMEKEFESNKV